MVRANTLLIGDVEQVIMSQVARLEQLQKAPKLALTNQPDTRIPPLETLARTLEIKVHQLENEDDVDRTYRLILGSEMIITMIERYYHVAETRNEYWPKIRMAWERIDKERHLSRINKLEERWARIRGDIY